MHGSTFGGNPLACRAALAVISTIDGDSLTDRAAALSQRIFADFKKKLKDLSAVKEVRGKGLMIGIELDRSCGELVARGLDAGVLINVAADNVVRLLPPLIMSDDEAGSMVSTVCDLIEAFCGDD
jgi:acetylornithine aminotransferase